MHISIKFYFDPYSILLPFTHMGYICFRFIIFSFIPFSLVLFSPFSHPSPIKTHVLSFEKQAIQFPYRTDLFSTILRILLSSSSLSRLNLSIILTSDIIPCYRAYDLAIKFLCTLHRWCIIARLQVIFISRTDLREPFDLLLHHCYYLGIIVVLLVWGFCFIFPLLIDCNFPSSPRKYRDAWKTLIQQHLDGGWI